MSWLSDSDADARLPVAIGTAAWLVALGVLLLRRDELTADGNSWWLGAAAVGLVSGLAGLLFLSSRVARRTHRRRATNCR